MIAKKVIFRKRIPEPKAMEEIEMKAFEELSVQNYKRWIVPLVDDVFNIAKTYKGMILDVGCGPGLLVKELATRSNDFKVVGVDISIIAIRLARKNCKGLPNTSFSLGGASKLPFKNRAFDIVVCKDSLHHFNNPTYVIREMLRVIKPGGILYIQDLRRDLPYYLLKRSIPCETVIQKLQYYSTRASYTKDEIKMFFKKNSTCDFIVRTRKVSNKLKQKYSKSGIDINQLREGFQARYIIMARKKL